MSRLKMRRGASTLATSVYLLLALQLAAQVSMGSTEASSVMLPDQLGPHFSCGKFFYRTLHLDEQRGTLLVGAMDRIFRVNLANVNKTHCLDDAIRLEPADTSKCISKGKSENYECRNHVRVIQPISKSANNDRFYVCGTNAFNPRHYMIHASNLSLSTEAPPGLGPQATCECPFDPEDNSTAVWVEHGNPSNLPAIYTGTFSDINKADPIVFRPELHNLTTGVKVHEAKRTQRFEPRWIDKPNFVGSFDVGDYVYFFFRENAYEFINCGKSIYSRVARVCKRDNGHKMLYEKVWTTYLKARLNCSIPGEFPFYFDEIQGIYRNPLDEKKFHAVFTTSSNGLTGSAICTFTVDAIQEAFEGKFKEQKSSEQAWLPVPSYKLNASEPRPGTCVDYQLSDHLVTFVRSHSLMDSAVSNDNGRPIFYRRDTIFTKIVVDQLEIDGARYTVFFAATNTGHVYKIVEWYPQQMAGDQARATGGGTGESQGGQGAPGAEAQATLVEVIEATVPEPVRAMEISARHKSLYVASDSKVKQINLLNCKQRHGSCLQCVRDPYCGWDRNSLECRHISSRDSLIQDVTNEMPDLCHNVLKHNDVHVTWGQSVHLPCPFNGFIQETQDLQQLLAAQHRHFSQRQLLYPPSSGSGHLASYGGGPLEAPTTRSLHGGLLQPANIIQWYYHRLDSHHSPGYQVLQHRDKFILAADQGLVILNAVEAGRFQCRLGNQIIYSYNLIIDTKTCAAPSRSEFQRIYADWCREIERYKSAYKSWHANQNRCQALAAGLPAQQQALGAHGHQLTQAGDQQQARRNHDMWSSVG